ncbi:MAG: hypothetical protein ACLPZR_04995 [Solirubrobacteraceae bacterium]
MALGEFDLAREALVEAVEIYSVLGSLMEAAPHTLLGGREFLCRPRLAMIVAGDDRGWRWL